MRKYLGNFRGTWLICIASQYCRKRFMTNVYVKFTICSVPITTLIQLSIDKYNNKEEFRVFLLSFVSTRINDSHNQFIY